MMVSKRASLGVHRRRGGRGEGLNQWMSFEMKVKNENFAGCVSSQCQLGLNGAASFHHDGGPESYRTWIKLCFYKEAIKYRKVAGVYMAKYGCLCLSLVVAKSSQSCLFLLEQGGISPLFLSHILLAIICFAKIETNGTKIAWSCQAKKEKRVEICLVHPNSSSR